MPIRIARHLIILLSGMFAIVTATCVSPFTDRLGSCVYIGNDPTVSSWCNAARRCQDIGGELLMDLTAIRAVNHWNSVYFIGVTDLLVEAGKSRSGWRFANGSLFPELNDTDWMPGRPDGNGNDDDFLVVSEEGLRDRSTNAQDKRFVCQPLATSNSKYFKMTEFLKLGNISPSYCSTDATASSETHCLLLCEQRWECRAALFNRASGACRMLDFTDASVGNTIETDPNWVKFVKTY